MEEGIKNRVILILVILTLIFFVGAVGSCNNASRFKSNRDKEIAARFDLEAKVNKLTEEKKAAEEKLNKSMQEFDAEKAAHDVTKKVLLQEQLVSQSLKEELQKVTKLKERLEENLKEALITEKTKAKK